MQSLASRLLSRLDEIARLVGELLDASTIVYDAPRLNGLAAQGLFVALPDYCWGALDDEQRRLQREILELWSPWLAQVTLLFSVDTKTRREELEEATAKFCLWIERDEQTFPCLPRSSGLGRSDEHLIPFYAALRALETSPSKVVVVPDTNLLLRSPDVVRYADVVARPTTPSFSCRASSPSSTRTRSIIVTRPYASAL